MPEMINWTLDVQVTGGPKILASRALSVEAYDKIEVAIPAEFPESARLTALGFIEFLAERTAGHPVRVLSERPSPDRMTFATPRAA